MSIISRFLNVFRPKTLERELDDEVRFHLDERAASNVRRGMTQPEAESTAREQFGEIRRVKHQMREVRMVNRKVIGAFALGVTVGVAAAVLPGAAIFHSNPYKVYRVGQEGVISPVVLHEVKPKYTAEAMHAKITGVVGMECVVTSYGVCYAVRVTNLLDHGLDAEAVNALMDWRFQPGQRRGKPVPLAVAVAMSFTLR